MTKDGVAWRAGVYGLEPPGRRPRHDRRLQLHLQRQRARDQRQDIQPDSAVGGHRFSQWGASGGCRFDPIRSGAADRIRRRPARLAGGKLDEFFVSETVPTPFQEPHQRSGLRVFASNALAGQSSPAAVHLNAVRVPVIFFARSYSWPFEFVVRAIKETGWTGCSRPVPWLSPLASMGTAASSCPTRREGVSARAGFRPARCSRA